MAGDVVATYKDPGLASLKLLVLQPLGPDKQPAGRTLIAADAVGAGIGEIVFFVRGREASFPFHRRHRRSLGHGRGKTGLRAKGQGPKGQR